MTIPSNSHPYPANHPSQSDYSGSHNQLPTPNHPSNESGSSETDPLIAAESGRSRSKRNTSKETLHSHCVGLAWTITILLALAGLGNAIVETVRLGRESSKDLHWLQSGNYILPGGFDVADVLDCATWAQWTPVYPNQDDISIPETPTTMFRLPVTRDTIYLGSSGMLSETCQLSISTSPSSDKMQLQVTVQTGDASRIKICSMRSSLKNGIVFMAPESSTSDTRTPVMKAELVLPETFHNGQVPDLDIDLEGYHIQMMDMGQLQFENVTVQTSNSDVLISNLIATRASIQTSNGKVEGTFSATEHLEIRTSNKPIKASIALMARSSLDSPTLKMSTSHSAIVTNLQLLGDATSTFKVDASTTYELLGVHVERQPLGSQLLLSGQTSQAPINAELAPGFEGTFVLDSFSKKTQPHHLTIQEGVSDPSHKSRQRKIDVDSRHTSSIAGAIYWGTRRPDDQHTGRVRFWTSDHPISITA